MLADDRPHRLLSTVVIAGAVLVLAATGVIAWGALLGVR